MRHVHSYCIHVNIQWRRERERKKSLAVETVELYAFFFPTCFRIAISQTSPGVYVSAVQVFWKYCGGKGEIARNEQSILFPQCFLPVWRTFCHFHKISDWRLQTFWVWKSLKFVVLKRNRRKNKWFSKGSRLVSYFTLSCQLVQVGGGNKDCLRYVIRDRKLTY